MVFVVGLEEEWIRVGKDLFAVVDEKWEYLEGQGFIYWPRYPPAGRVHQERVFGASVCLSRRIGITAL